MPRRRPVPDSLFGGRLRGAWFLDLEVVRTEDIAPHVRLFTLGSFDLVEFEFSPGQDLMIEFPDGHRTMRRRYTIRRADPSAGTVDLEFELHGGGGTAVRWATGAGVGSRLEAIGPRGTVVLRPEIERAVFVADDAAMPAACAMVEALPAGASAIAILLTPHGPRSRPGPLAAADVEVYWVGEPELPAALDGIDLRSPEVAYVNGERNLVRRTADLLAAAGMDRSQIAAKAYWRRDQANAAHGEPARD